jgi:hypothetical protein
MVPDDQGQPGLATSALANVVVLNLSGCGSNASERFRAALQSPRAPLALSLAKPHRVFVEPLPETRAHADMALYAVVSKSCRRWGGGGRRGHGRDAVRERQRVELPGRSVGPRRSLTCGGSAAFDAHIAASVKQFRDALQSIRLSATTSASTALTVASATRWQTAGPSMSSRTSTRLAVLRPTRRTVNVGEASCREQGCSWCSSLQHTMRANHFTVIGETWENQKASTRMPPPRRSKRRDS